MTTSIDDLQLEPRTETYCPACGESCPAEATTCMTLGQRPIVPVVVEWTPRVVGPLGGTPRAS